MMRLAVAAQPSPLGMAIELALTTGMRRGEVCALRWSDLGDDGTITVSHALGNAEGGFYLKEPKTDSSERTIPPHPPHLPNAQVHAGGVAAPRSRVRPLGRLLRPGHPGAGEPTLQPTQLGKDFAAFCKMNGFRCTFHDLRHTFATMMIAAGTDVRTVASYLGHASVSMTLNIYADVDPDAKKAAVSKVDRLLRREHGGGLAHRVRPLRQRARPAAPRPHLHGGPARSHARPGQDLAGRRGVRSRNVTLENASLRDHRL
ncbi:site-specific integrase [Olsenella sp. Marseille-P4559]|uniref:site-specific integrase n=1 Tax=Olsenella sp. Marseille-P4559 TaxID=2364795 RepID=UPI001030FFE2|nr:site-specific integrase [Olsenella sp. Marseille-P4559]